MPVMFDPTTPSSILVSQVIDPFHPSEEMKRSARDILQAKLETLRGSLNTSPDRSMRSSQCDENIYILNLVARPIASNVVARADTIGLKTIQQFYDAHACLTQLRASRPNFFRTPALDHLRENYVFLRSVFGDGPAQASQDSDLICARAAAVRFFERPAIGPVGPVIPVLYAGTLKEGSGY